MFDKPLIDQSKKLSTYLTVHAHLWDSEKPRAGEANSAPHLTIDRVQRSNSKRCAPNRNRHSKPWPVTSLAHRSSLTSLLLSLSLRWACTVKMQNDTVWYSLDSKVWLSSLLPFWCSVALVSYTARLGGSLVWLGTPAYQTSSLATLTPQNQRVLNWFGMLVSPDPLGNASWGSQWLASFWALWAVFEVCWFLATLSLS